PGSSPPPPPPSPSPCPLYARWRQEYSSDWGVSSCNGSRRPRPPGPWLAYGFWHQRFARSTGSPFPGVFGPIDIPHVLIRVNLHHLDPLAVRVHDQRGPVGVEERLDRCVPIFLRSILERQTVEHRHDQSAALREGDVREAGGLALGLPRARGALEPVRLEH